MSCGKLTPQPRDLTFKETLVSNYVLDSDAGGLFEKNSWYTYYIKGHLSLTTLDVYGIRSKGKFYKLQIIEFYRNNNNELLGYYQLRIDRGAGLEVLDVDAHACGHPQSNPDYGPCQRTDKNRYAYVDLATFNIRYLSDNEALNDLKWDIAFKADFIKLNSGKSGPGEVRGAVLSKDLSYTSGDDQIRFNRLFSAFEGNRDLARFEASYREESARFFGPDGISRVIYEDFWYQENNLGLRTAKSDNWWLIKNFDEKSYAKFNIKNITKNPSDATESIITMSVHVQEKGESRFSLESEDFSFSVFSEKRKFLCIELNGGLKTISCSKSSPWDVRFINNQGLWRIETRKGAIGPLKTNVIIDISSGV